MKPMKVAQVFSLLVVICLLGPVVASAQYTYSPASAPPSGGYSGVAPSLPPPSYSSGYGSSFAPQSSYNSQPPAQANTWAGGPTIGSSATMLDYSYLEAGYRYVDPKGNALDGSHGLAVTASFTVLQKFFVKGVFNWSSGTGGNTVRSAADADYTFSTISVAGGGFLPITDKLHLVGEVGLIYANLDTSDSKVSYSDGGVYIRPGLRYQALDFLELQGGVTVNSANDYDSKIIDLAAYLRLMPQVDFNLGADFGDQNRTMKAGVRLRW